MFTKKSVNNIGPYSGPNYCGSVAVMMESGFEVSKITLKYCGSVAVVMESGFEDSKILLKLQFPFD